MHNSVLCFLYCLTFLTGNFRVTEKKQQTTKKQNTTHPSDPNRISMLKPIGGRSVLAQNKHISMLKISTLEKKGAGKRAKKA